MGSLNGPKFYVVVKKRHNNFYYRRLTMEKYIGFDIDSKKTIACVVQKDKKDRFTTIKTDHRAHEKLSDISANAWR